MFHSSNWTFWGPGQSVTSQKLRDSLGLDRWDLSPTPRLTLVRIRAPGSLPLEANALPTELPGAPIFMLFPYSLPDQLLSSGFPILGSGLLNVPGNGKECKSDIGKTASNGADGCSVRESLYNANSLRARRVLTFVKKWLRNTHLFTIDPY